MRVGGGCTWGEVDARDGRARPRDAERDHLDHRRRRPHARRRPRPPDAQVRARRSTTCSRPRSCSPTASSVRASADENPDLFWAIRGGGGNFGVVTSFLFRLHEVGTIVGGPTFWPVEQGAEVLSAYREFLPGGPARAERLLRVPHRAAGAAVPGGDPPAQGVRRRLVLRRLGGGRGRGRWRRCSTSVPEPLMHGVGADAARRRCRARSTASTRPATSGTGAPTSSRRSRTRRSQIHARFGAEMPTLKSTMHMYPIDGAAHDVGSTDTAWSYRDATWGSVFAGVDPDPANVDAIRQLERRLLRGAAPVLRRRRLREHDDGRGPGAGARELPRQLRPAGSRSRPTYDPDNLFRVNQNIQPKA